MTLVTRGLTPVTTVVVMALTYWLSCLNTQVWCVHVFGRSGISCLKISRPSLGWISLWDGSNDLMEAFTMLVLLEYLQR